MQQMTPMDDFTNILPPEITAKATRAGNEWVLPLPEANQAIRLASIHRIAVRGVEAFRIQADGLGVENYSGYVFEYQGDWQAYISLNNEAALHFVAAHPAGPGDGYILTTASEDEFRTLSDSTRVNVQRVEESGFAIVPQCLDEQAVERLCFQLGKTKHAQRNLLHVPAVRDLAVVEPVRKLVASILGKNCFAVRGMLFNKTPDSNWKVVWHQDKTIAVRERKEVAHFGPWSIKAGVPHVQPPTSVMAKMLAIRLHLDESHENNGPLRVVPGSHVAGNLSAEEIASWRERPSVLCTVPRGGAILMRPLLIHASSSSLKPETRRVVHLEFAADELPGGLEWHDRA